MLHKRTFSRLLAVAMIAAAMLVATASVAFAATPDPTLGLAALQTKLDAAPDGTIMGYLKTVVTGSKIETIPVQVLSITGDDPSSALILFEAQGDKIAKFGGIVAGMSGSPIYVDDNGVDKVIGALSYGDAFTIGGSGLATPIEAMLQLEDAYAPRVQSLSSPVLMSGRVVDKVIIPSASNVMKTPSQAGGAFVARPLASTFIGGVRPNSLLFARLKKSLEAHGLSVLALGSALSSGNSTFTTDLVPGAAVGSLASRGDMWIGGLGTITYADTSTVLAFGHPVFWTGDTSLYLTNAWVNGVWPSQYQPYKIGIPSVIRGTITEDRNAGSLGVLGATPPEVPLTATVTDVASGRSANSTVYMTSSLYDSGQTSYYTGLSLAIAGSKLYAPPFDQYNRPGSATTTTTVVVSDGTKNYTVSIKNVLDNSYDIPSMIGSDADLAVSSLLSVLGDNIETPHIVSVNLEASIAKARRSAVVVGVRAVSPLKVGDNRIQVSLLANGIAATQTVDTTITIPRGMPTSGLLTASGIYASSSDGSSGDGSGDTGSDSAPMSSGYSRPTIAQVVDSLNTTPQNNTLDVVFYPTSFSAAADGAPTSSSSSDTTVSIEATTVVPWVTDGLVQIQATELTSRLSEATIPFGGDAEVTGEVFGPQEPVTVSVYGTPAGGTEETLLATDTATLDRDTGALSYDVYVPEFYTNTTLRVHIDGGSYYTGADAFVTQKVQAYVRLSASAKSVRYGRSVTLTAQVAPGTAKEKVTFQYYDSARRSWRTIGSRALTPGSTFARATWSWKPPKGTRKVRFVYAGGLMNAGATSSSITIVTK
jgi:hypothetical protein